MDKLKTYPFSPDRDGRVLITDIYITTMLLVFPLFVGFSGYEKTTVSKFLFFAIATGIWTLGLILLTFLRRGLKKPAPHRVIALVLMGIVCISAVLSPYRDKVLLGAGRYDGLVTQLLYGCVFLGVSACGRIRRHHFAAFGAALTLCGLVALLQLFDIRVFFPGDLSYYDKGIRFSGEFMGTIGNTNVLSELLCLAIPVFFILPVISDDRKSLWGIIPLSLAIIMMLRIWVSGGLLALACCALIGAPVVITSLPRLRKALAMAAFCMIPAYLALGFQPEFANRQFSWSFSFDYAPLFAAAAAVLLLVALALGLIRKQPTERKMRRALAFLAALAVLGALAAVYFTPAESGTVYELSRVLHGEIDDSFGSSRILIWRECLAAWLDSPLFGYGPDTTALSVDIDFSRYVEETGSTLRSGVDNAHNIYLGYMLNTGIFSAIAFCALLVCGGLRWLNTLGSTGKCALGLAMLCAAVQGFFALGLCLSMPVFWICLALLFSPEETSLPD